MNMVIKSSHTDEKCFNEAIGIMQEEAAEVIQALSKIRRSGTSYTPHEGDVTNLELAQNEVYDFIILAQIAGFSTNVPSDFLQGKLERLRKWSTLSI